jgi:hypothetical protein
LSQYPKEIKKIYEDLEEKHGCRVKAAAGVS